jgi:hypothetical protein
VTQSIELFEIKFDMTFDTQGDSDRGRLSMNDEHEAELVMPFVVCKSEGGPFEDEAFVCGVRFGQHRYELSTCQGVIMWADYITPQMVPQYDLLAMDLGFVMTIEPADVESCEDHPYDWVLAVFKRPEPTDELEERYDGND